MPGLATITIVGLIVVAILVPLFLKLRRQDQLGEIIQKRQPSARLVSRAEYVEGVEQIPVALSLVGESIYYENPDLDASFDLDRIEEVEYSDELATGRRFDARCRVLRLRSHGAVFEFLLQRGDCEKWMQALPPRQMGGASAAAG